MNFKQAILTAAILVAATATKAAPTVIDFDELTSGTNVDSTYSGLGVSFSNARTYNFGSLAGSSSPITIASASGTVFGPSNAISALFTTGMSAVSITGVDVGAAGIVMTAYDALVGGSVVDSDSFFGTGLGIGTFHTLTVSGSGILRVEFSQSAPCCGDGVAFDNFSFEAGNSVPTPATPALLSLGLLALGFTSRRAR
jgi:hypothetical protein